VLLFAFDGAINGEDGRIKKAAAGASKTLAELAQQRPAERPVCRAREDDSTDDLKHTCKLGLEGSF
jgi:hypothetical protein